MVVLTIGVGPRFALYIGRDGEMEGCLGCDMIRWAVRPGCRFVLHNKSFPNI